MKCRNCMLLSEPTTIGKSEFPSVRCTLGLWDKEGVKQWYSWGESQLNRGPIKRLGAVCTQGIEKCPKCGGSGDLLEVMELHGMPHIMGKTPCDKCNGTGKASKAK